MSAESAAAAMSTGSPALPNEIKLLIFAELLDVYSIRSLALVLRDYYYCLKSDERKIVPRVLKREIRAFTKTIDKDRAKNIKSLWLCGSAQPKDLDFVNHYNLSYAIECIRFYTTVDFTSRKESRGVMQRGSMPEHSTTKVPAAETASTKIESTRKYFEFRYFFRLGPNELDERMVSEGGWKPVHGSTEFFWRYPLDPEKAVKPGMTLLLESPPGKAGA
jgi:hypothetical protein